jgi:hypothetical protein
MKKFLLPAVMLFSLSAHALVGERGNGGNTVDVDGITRLKDLVDKTICSWVDGEALINKNQILADALKKLSFVDWYFAQDLENEIKSLSYCMTGKLVTIDTNDYDSLVTAYHLKSEQVAIRLNRAVYINESLMNSMPKYDQAFLVIHEAIHTYIDQDAEMRNQKVRSSVRAIESVYKGNLASTRSYHLQMRNNAIDFPFTVEALTSRKDATLFIIGDYAEKRSIIMSENSVERVFDKVKNFPDYLLATWHQDLINYTNVENFVSQAIQQEDLLVLKRMIDAEASVRETTLSVLYSSEIAQNNQTIRDFLASEANIQELVSNTFNKISAHTVTKNGQGRLIIPGMELLAKNSSSDETPFTSLEALNSNTYLDLRSELKAFIQHTILLIQNKNDKALDQMIFNNPEFYEAFATKDLKEKLNATSVSFELERTTALRKVDSLLNGFWKLAKAQIEPQVDRGEWNKFVKKIDQEKLGYTIK